MASGQFARRSVTVPFQALAQGSRRLRFVPMSSAIRRGQGLFAHRFPGGFSDEHAPDLREPAAQSSWRTRTEQIHLNRSPRNRGTRIPLIYGHFRVRHDKIDTNGTLTLRHNSRLHHIGLGRRHAGTTVLVLVHDLHVRVLSTQRTTTARPATGPDTRLPTTRPNGNDVAGHL